MVKLVDAARLVVDHGQSILVCDADADRLQHMLKELMAPGKVVFADFRKRMPANVQEELEGPVRENQIVHVAIAGRLDLRLFRTLSYLRDRYRGRPVILSTSVPTRDKLDFSDELKDIFPHTVCAEDHTAKYVPEPFSQAVVLIHGIGEQRPGRPLRSFADAVLRPATSNTRRKKYHTAYDEVSFDYRKLIAEVEQDRVAPDAAVLTPRLTDFYEYYWAAKVEETSWRQVVRWLWSLLRHRPPAPLIAVWVISWLIVVIGLITGIVGTSAWITGVFRALPAIVVSIASWVGLGILQTVILDYVGDAARYFDDHPTNDKIRTDIRRGGVDLIRSLIESRKYDRIVLVGHSLGGVIAYDVLKHLWETEFWPVLADTGLQLLSQPALDAYEAAANKLGPQSDDSEIVRYQEKQMALLKELRDLGSPWPVTDLITVGNPLVHAPYLVPNFKERRLDGELPENPPKAFGEHRALLRTPESLKEVAGRASRLATSSFQPRTPFPNGLFLVTRWTNLYFPTRFGLFGDLVGGPLRPLFGHGIRDREVATGNPLRDQTLLAHVSYWHVDESTRAKARKGNALPVLIEALDLNGERLGIPRHEKWSVWLAQSTEPDDLDQSPRGDHVAGGGDRAG